jgi:antitoxin CptB
VSRLEWRCRRGTRELDHLLQRYLREGYPRAAREEQEAFERLLELQDPELQDLFSGFTQPKEPELIHVVHRILYPQS